MPYAPASPRPTLLEQGRHHLRLKHFSIRTEEAYVQTIKRFIFYQGDAPARQAGQLRNVRGPEVEREAAHDLAEFKLRNFRPPVIAV